MCRRMFSLKKIRPTNREMTTPLFLLCCLQVGLSLRDPNLLTASMVNDILRSI